ncbi:kinesin-like protein KIF16B isoform X2 [Dunckerocampus dactyliophorus]|uniref:kinesin-like protein KIF16B isoform X2 n=1 Tax=Dunckerocampus dactyliophorus TaxID=161453 RepID=UPI002405C881|nr:kinesin-like protein KIF16B isoform X2 [Dunckerocampus dactyliophorus]
MASVRVAVRVRPMDRREKDLMAKCIIKMDGTKTTITNLKIPEGITGDSTRDRTKTFTYDFSYDSADCKSSTFVSQDKVFRDLGSDVLKAAFEGYNACVFAYGQTGSGKSYTMMGNPGDAGLIPRICERLFGRIADATRWDEASFRTEVSYLEIYNERVRDLLRRKSTQTYNLRVREHPKDGPYVEDLSKHLVQNYSDVEELMEAGNINRTTASTGMNDVSSRSHAIFTINFTQAKFDAEMPSETVSKIHLVDLAGSERADSTGATGVRLKEGGNINKSLVTLGNVISALADLTQDGVNTNQKKKSVFVPYRDSVLTWLLKDSLGGNSKTIMIATVSPADINYGETLSTLRYANRAKNIINKPTINEDANVRLIRELRAEIARLKALLIEGNQIALLDSPTALSMEEKLHQNEARVLQLTKEWTNKWNETQNILKEETLALRKEGIGVVLDSELPHLIGIDDDLLSTGIILYHLKEGRTFVGREDASTEQDIILHGLDLESEHCVFENQNGTVTLVPLSGAQCCVNGVQVTTPTQLNQGAVILLGRTNMFRFNHPKEAAKLREKRKSGLLSSFSLSMSDLSQSCENLSTVMLYNPGLEFERQQREELDKLEVKRRLIKEMEAKQQSEKAELERLQQEVESQRKESEEVHQRILRQEESLRRRSQDMEILLRHLLEEKQRFEEDRRSQLQEVQEGAEEKQDEEQREIYRELEELKRAREEQHARLETERRRLEEQEKEQLSLVGRLQAQLRDEEEAALSLQSQEEAGRLEEEQRSLADIREALLRAREVGGAIEEARNACDRYTDFKGTQVEELGRMEEALQRQKEHLEKEVTSLIPLAHNLKEEQHLHSKERQLRNLAQNLLPALAEEKQRAEELLEHPPGPQELLYQVEKELQEKEEKLEGHRACAQHLLHLQETYQFTADVARQEEKVRLKEKEILESKEKQQQEALEEAVGRLKRRHLALRRCASMEEKVAHREEQESYKREENSRTTHVHTLLPLSDDRINAYIEEEVQRRLRNMNLLNGLSLSCQPLQEEQASTSTQEEDKPPNKNNPLKFKYETDASVHQNPPEAQQNPQAEPGTWEEEPASMLEFRFGWDHMDENRNMTEHVDKRRVRSLACDPASSEELTGHGTRTCSHQNSESKEPYDGQTVPLESKKRSSLGYFAVKLSEVYRTAGLGLQVTRDIFHGVGVRDVKDLLSYYVTLMSKEFPLIHLREPTAEPVADPAVEPPHVHTGHKVSLLNVAKDGALPLSVDWSNLAKGSVSCVKSFGPHVFSQSLVLMPPALDRLQASPSHKMLETLETLAPCSRVGLLLSVFWLRTASAEKPLPQAACLLVSEKALTVVSSGAGSEDTLAVFQHVGLCQIHKVQISLAGQHVHLLGSSNDVLLVVFTHSKELAQEFCRVVLNAVAPEKSSELVKGHPLLDNDLMVLCLDWTARVPDIVMDHLVITSRFKRVLADLLYVVHGNMAGSDKPSLAAIQPLLYTSTRISCTDPDAILQFFLTDTHVVLLQEDAVFHPALPGSILLPVQPHFRILDLRRRKDISCVLLKRRQECLLVQIVFKNPPNGSTHQSHSWKLSFGCIPEVAILVQHLCS